MSKHFAPGTKGFIHLPRASYLSRSYTPVTVVDTQHHMIWVVADEDPNGEVHMFQETTRTHHTGSKRTLILDGEPRYRHAAARHAYDTLVADTERIVTRWSYDARNPGLALQASEALRILASTPEPRKD